MVKKYQLTNGLTVLLQPSHKSPVVSVQMWVRTGSADETPEEAGISHFIEHLVFKGSRSFAVGEIAAVVEGSGGELNAYTSFDQTVFHVTISRTYLNVGLQVISEMIGWPQFAADEIDREREVVIEEIKRSNDSPGRQASRLLFETVFEGHPYARPVIGYEDIIRSVSRTTLVEYFHGRYNPQNMFLVVAGDFDESAITGQIEEHFAGLPTYPLRTVQRSQVPELQNPRTAVRSATFEENYLFLAWQIPGADDPAAPLFDVLALILGQGESSRLVHGLRIEKGIVNSVGASAFTPLQSGLFAISVTFNIDKLTAILEVIADEVVKFMTHGPTEEELAKAVTNFESETYYTMETVDGLARKAGNYEFLMNDPNYFTKFLEIVARTSPNEITRLARQYLQPKNLQVCILSGKEDTNSILQRVDQWRANFAKSTQQILDPVALSDGGKQTPGRGSTSTKGKTKKAVHSQVYRQNENILMPLPHGGSAIYRISRETPTVSMRAGFLGGVRAETGLPEGLTELLARTWDTATLSKTEPKIKSRLDQLASAVSSFGGRNTVGVTLESLRPFADETFVLFADILAAPAFADEILLREREILAAQIKNESDNPTRIASHNFAKGLFGGHPYARRQAGTGTSIVQVDSHMIRDYWRRLVNGTNFWFVASGDIDVDTLHDKVSQLCAQLGPGEKFTRVFAHESPDREVHLYEPLAKQQSHIIWGFKGLVLTDPQRYALQLLEAILAGQGGRLFIELRDKASLAYSVAPIRMEGVDTGYFGAYIGCSPEKAPTAIQMLRQEFDKLMETPVSEKELERAKRYLIGRHDIDLQRSSSISAAIMFDTIYGLDGEEAFRFAERIQNVSKEDIQTLARELFAQHSVTSLVGPNSLW